MKIENQNLDERILTEIEKEIVTCECCGRKYMLVDMPESSPTICFDCRGYTDIYPTNTTNNNEVYYGWVNYCIEWREGSY